MINMVKNFVANRLSLFRKRRGLAATLILILWAASSAHAQVVATTSQTASDNWNKIFEKKPGAAYGWSGGDGAMSIALPYCSACTSDKYRYLWLFGDSYRSTVGTGTTGHNFRVNAQGQRGHDNLGGNTIGITYHSTATDYSANSVTFDWGATGIYHPWMPLLLDTSKLADMDDLRIAASGYNSLDFSNDGDIVKVYRGGSDGDIIPIYEYYNAFVTSNDYRTDMVLDGSFGLVYKGIAFWVHKTKVNPDMIPLYRYYSGDVTDVLLSTSATVSALFGYTNPQILGYVFPAEYTGSESGMLTSLFQYFRTPSYYDFHHAYTVEENDIGKEIGLWPSRGIVIGNDLVYLFGPVTNSETGAPWHNVNSTVATIITGVNRPYSQWGKTLQGNWSTAPKQYELTPTNARITWGVFLMKDSDYATNHYIYVYGIQNGPSLYDPDHQLVVARVACSTASDFVNFSNWRFYSNGTWKTTQQNITPILDGIGADFTIHKSPNSRFVIAYTQSLSVIWARHQITFASGMSPVGPFTRHPTTLDLSTYINEKNETSVIVNEKNESELVDNYTYYAANGHEGLAPNDSLLISYIRTCTFSRSPVCPSDDERSSVYVPRFVTVPWASLDY